MTKILCIMISVITLIIMSCIAYSSVPIVIDSESDYVQMSCDSTQSCGYSYIGTCPDGYGVQNTTSSGVDCVLLNASINVTFATDQITALNATKVDVFNCPAGQAVQNGSAHNVQCIAVISGGDNSSFNQSLTDSIYAKYNFTNWTLLGNLSTAWLIGSDQTGLTGDKTGTFNLTTTGTGTFGGFKMTASPSAGYVLTSDVDGNGSWAAVGGIWVGTATSDLDMGTAYNIKFGAGSYGLTDGTYLSVDPYSRQNIAPDGVTVVADWTGATGSRNYFMVSGIEFDTTGSGAYIDTYTDSTTDVIDFYTQTIGFGGSFFHMGTLSGGTWSGGADINMDAGDIVNADDVSANTISFLMSGSPHAQIDSYQDGNSEYVLDFNGYPIGMGGGDIHMYYQGTASGGGNIYMDAGNLYLNAGTIYADSNDYFNMGGNEWQFYGYNGAGATNYISIGEYSGGITSIYGLHQRAGNFYLHGNSIYGGTGVGTSGGSIYLEGGGLYISTNEYITGGSNYMDFFGDTGSGNAAMMRVGVDNGFSGVTFNYNTKYPSGSVISDGSYTSFDAYSRTLNKDNGDTIVDYDVSGEVFVYGLSSGNGIEYNANSETYNFVVGHSGSNDNYFIGVSDAAETLEIINPVVLDYGLQISGLTTAGFMKTDSSGYVSVDGSTYIPPLSNSYSCSNYNTVTSIDMQTATIGDIANFICTFVTDIGS